MAKSLKMVLKGPLVENKNIHVLLDKISEELSKSLRDFIKEEFINDIKLMSFVNMRQDKEAITAILRSFNVKIKSYKPLILDANFKDVYGHWYATEKLPDEVEKMIREMIDKSSKKWAKTDNAQKIVREVILGNN